jgi:hypothetical protein
VLGPGAPDVMLTNSREFVISRVSRMFSSLMTLRRLPAPTQDIYPGDRRFSDPTSDARPGPTLREVAVALLGCLLLFVAGFRELIKTVSPGAEWIGNIASAAGLVYVAITLVSSGLEAGAVIATDHPIDPTISVSGTYILYGSIGRMLLGMFLCAVGYAIGRTRVLPRWTGRSAYALGAVSFACIPSMFFGNKPRSSTPPTAGAPPPPWAPSSATGSWR